MTQLLSWTYHLLLTAYLIPFYPQTCGEYTNEEIQLLVDFICQQDASLTTTQKSFPADASSSFASFTSQEVVSSTANESFTSMDMSSFEAEEGYNFKVDDESQYISGSQSDLTTTTDQSHIITNQSNYSTEDQSSYSVEDQSNFSTEDQSSYSTEDQSNYSAENQSSMNHSSIDSSSFTSTDGSSFTSLNSSSFTVEESSRVWSSKGDKSCMSPSGQVFRSKKAAIEHLLQVGGSQEEIRAVQDLYIAQGWSREGLPQGWLGRADPKNYSFVSADAKYFSNKRKAEDHLMAIGGSEEDRLLLQRFTGGRNHSFMKNQNHPKAPISTQRAVWVPSAAAEAAMDDANACAVIDAAVAAAAASAAIDAAVAAAAVSAAAAAVAAAAATATEITNSELKEKLQKEEKEAIAYYDNEEEKVRSEEEREKLRSTKKLRVSEAFKIFPDPVKRRELLELHGWRTSPFLPEGWMERAADKNRVSIITATGKLLESYRAVVELLAEQYGQREVEKFLLYPEGVCSAARRNKYSPASKVKRRVQEGEEQEEEDDGMEGVEKEIEDVQDEVEKLVQEVEKDVADLEAKVEVGTEAEATPWQPNPMLPAGWLYRETSGSSLCLQSSEGTRLSSLKAAAGYMEWSGRYSREDINRVYKFPGGREKAAKRSGGEDEEEQSPNKKLKAEVGLAAKEEQDSVVEAVYGAEDGDMDELENSTEEENGEDQIDEEQEVIDEEEMDDVDADDLDEFLKKEPMDGDTGKVDQEDNAEEAETPDEEDIDVQGEVVEDDEVEGGEIMKSKHSEGDDTAEESDDNFTDSEPEDSVDDSTEDPTVNTTKDTTENINSDNTLDTTGDPTKEVAGEGVSPGPPGPPTKTPVLEFSDFGPLFSKLGCSISKISK